MWSLRTFFVVFTVLLSFRVRLGGTDEEFLLRTTPKNNTVFWVRSSAHGTKVWTVASAGATSLSGMNSSRRSQAKPWSPTVAAALRTFFGAGRRDTQTHSGGVDEGGRGPPSTSLALADKVCPKLTEPPERTDVLLHVQELKKDAEFRKQREAFATSLQTSAFVTDVVAGIASTVGPMQKQVPGHEPENMKQKCADWLQKRQFNLESPFSKEEAGFPLAYIVLLHKNIGQAERLLRAVWHKQNSYCIHVDLHAPDAFKNQVRALVHCLNLVVGSSSSSTSSTSPSAVPAAPLGQTFLVSDPVRVYYASFTRLEADLRCMRDLHSRNIMYKYVLNLCGQDYPLKSNLQLVRDLDSLQGRGETFSVDVNLVEKLWRVKQVWRLKPEAIADIKRERQTTVENSERKAKAAKLDADWRSFFAATMVGGKGAGVLGLEGTSSPSAVRTAEDENENEKAKGVGGAGGENAYKDTSFIYHDEAAGERTAQTPLEVAGEVSVAPWIKQTGARTTLTTVDGKIKQAPACCWFGSPLEDEASTTGTGVFAGSAYYALARPTVAYILENEVAQRFLNWTSVTYSPDEIFWATIIRHFPFVPGSFPPYQEYDLGEIRARPRLYNWLDRAMTQEQLATTYDPVQTQAKYLPVKYLYKYLLQPLLFFPQYLFQNGATTRKTALLSTDEETVVKRQGLFTTWINSWNWNYDPFLAARVRAVGHPYCEGKEVRKACVYGALDLPWILSAGGHWFANKFDYRFDAVPQACLDWKLQREERRAAER